MNLSMLTSPRLKHLFVAATLSLFDALIRGELPSTTGGLRLWPLNPRVRIERAARIAGEKNDGMGARGPSREPPGDPPGAFPQLTRK